MTKLVSNLNEANWRTYATLLLVTLAPRMIAALSADTIRSDSVYFIEAAEKIDAGKAEDVLAYLGPNPYVAALWGLHKLGLDYELGGTLWGLAVSTLTVLPLFGFARRKFGGRIGLVSAFLYAVHPRFIEWGPEIIRDPTFWLFFVWTLYLIERAHGGYQISWYLAAATTLTIAAHLRSEGWLLLIPATAAAVHTTKDVAIRSRRTLLASVAAVLLLPIGVMILMNRVFFSDDPQWGRLDYLAIGIESKAREAWGALFGATSDITGANESRHSLGRELAHLAQKIVKGFTPYLLAFTMVGLYRLRCHVFRPGFGAPLIMAMTIFVLTGAYLFSYGEINTRYVMAGTLPFLPYAAYGIVVVRNRLLRYARRYCLDTRVISFRVTVSFAALLAVIGTAESLDVNRTPLRDEAALGNWIRETFGEQSTVACWEDRRLVRYYACSRPHLLLPPTSRTDWEPLLRVARPEVVLLGKTTPAAVTEEFTAAHALLGYRREAICDPNSGISVYRRRDDSSPVTTGALRHAREMRR